MKRRSPVRRSARTAGFAPEDGPELGRDRCRIGDERLVRGQVARLHRDGERVAAAVEDRAALGGQFEGAQPLVECSGGEGLAAHGLQLDEAPGEDGQHQAGRDEEDGAATPRVRQGQDARPRRTTRTPSLATRCGAAGTGPTDGGGGARHAAATGDAITPPAPRRVLRPREDTVTSMSGRVLPEAVLGGGSLRLLACLLRVTGLLGCLLAAFSSAFSCAARAAAFAAAACAAAASAAAGS